MEIRDYSSFNIIPFLGCTITTANNPGQTLVKPHTTYRLNIGETCSNFAKKLYVWNTDIKYKGSWERMSAKPYQQCFDAEFFNVTLVSANQPQAVKSMWPSGQVLELVCSWFQIRNQLGDETHIK